MSEGNATGPVRWVLQTENAAVMAIGLWVYAQTGASWWLFAALILLPDVTMVGYLKSKRPGAALYNLGHTYVAPLVLGACAVALSVDWLGHIALIWLVHIAMDRAIGYGLKYKTGFKHTHLSHA